MTPYEIFKASVNDGVNPEDFTEIVLSTLSNAETTDSQIGEILRHYETQKYFDANAFVELIEILTNNNKLENHKDAISQLIEGVSYRTESRPIELIIGLVISANGQIRDLGRLLFDKFNISEPEVNILDRHFEIQVKFSISLSQSFSEPEQHIKHTIILLNSSSEDVRKILLHVLTQYSLNYYGLVKRIFDETESSYNKSLELDIFKEMLDAMERRFDNYAKCYELHSEYFFPEIYEIVQTEWSRFLQEKMQEITENYKSPLRNLFKPIELGRGGGFRQANGHVQGLANISVSKPSPMFMYSMNPMEEIEYFNTINKNWDKTEEDE